jgi:hypothetical protein
MEAVPVVIIRTAYALFLLTLEEGQCIYSGPSLCYSSTRRKESEENIMVVWIPDN